VLFQIAARLLNLAARKHRNHHLLDDRGRHLRLDLGEENVLLRLRAHAYQGTLAAQPHASTAVHLHLGVELSGLDLRLQSGDHTQGVRRLTASAGAGEQAHIEGLLLGKLRGRSYFKFFRFHNRPVLQSVRLQSLPRAGVYSARSSASATAMGLSIWMRSITWWLASVFNLAYTLPFTETRGANPQQPRQRTACRWYSLSGVLWPSLIFSSFSIPLSSSADPLMWHAVPRHTEITYLPGASSLK